jgi:tetratricopeptide (TPR) repeat protein
VNKLSREGRHDEAKVILQQLIKMRPDNPLIWNDLGLACDALGQLDEAVESFRRGIEVHSPAFPPLLFHLAKVLLRRFRRDTPLAHRKTPEAKKMLLEINGLLNSNLDQNPGNIEAHKLLAETLKIAEQDELAAAHLEIVRRAERFTE